MPSNFKPLHEQIAEKLIAELKAGTSPFQKPWTNDNSSSYFTPLNPTTGKNYRGMNALWLAMQGRDDPRWMTLKQASFNHWTVEKGAKATLINFVKQTDIRPVLDEKGQPVIKENGKPQTQTVKLDKPIITTAFVFNGEQIKGIPEWKEAYAEKIAAQQWTPIERAEMILADSKADIQHGGNEAYYKPSTDQIRLPKPEQFDAAAKYYATALHELGHWSGHESRLDRKMTDHFGSPEYAREELRAEIASLMIGSELNIGHDFGQHAAYVDNWIEVLEKEPNEVFKASADAQKIFDFVLGFEQKREQKEEVAEKVSLKTLNAGDVIPYNDKTYTVGETLKGKTIVTDEEGIKTKVSAKDGLYASLLNARNNPQAQEQEQNLSQEMEPELAEAETTGYKMKR
jgi:antirestriction protein ArdC